MSTVLAQLATLTVGISTPAFLYINEAVHAAHQAGTSAHVVTRLASVPGHAAVVSACQFPKDATYQNALSRIACSSAYHRRLAGEPAIFAATFAALREATGVPFIGDRQPSLRPEDAAAAFFPYTHNFSRRIDQLEAAKLCFGDFAALPEPDDILGNEMDTCLFIFHMLVGLWVLYDILLSNLYTGAIPWSETTRSFDFTESFFDAGARRGLQAYIKNIDILSSASLPLTPEIGGKPSVRARAAWSAWRDPRTSFRLSEMTSDALKDMLRVFGGIDVVLASFHETLSRYTGDGARRLAALADELRRTGTQPLLQKFSTKPPPPAQGHS